MDSMGHGIAEEEEAIQNMQWQAVGGTSTLTRRQQIDPERQ